MACQLAAIGVVVTERGQVAAAALEDGGATDLVVLLDDGDLQSGPRQIARRHKSVVAGTDD
jgi:hypothetical protein